MTASMVLRRKLTGEPPPLAADPTPKASPFDGRPAHHCAGPALAPRLP